MVPVTATREPRAVRIHAAAGNIKNFCEKQFENRILAQSLEQAGEARAQKTSRRNR